MDRKILFIKPLFWLVTIMFVASLLSACQSVEELIIETSKSVSTVIPKSSFAPTITTVLTGTPAPTETTDSTQIPTSTEEEIVEIDPAIIERFLNRCEFTLRPVDDLFPNPQETLNPLTGTTWMVITVPDGVLHEQDSFRFWWDTRAFSADLSFNKGNGLCEVLIETNQIKCEGIPLRGTENLPTGGYEYDFKLYIENEECNYKRNYQQRGLIYMKTMEHDVFSVNGEDVP
jgi:hypothetical protein